MRGFEARFARVNCPPPGFDFRVEGFSPQDRERVLQGLHLIALVLPPTAESISKVSINRLSIEEASQTGSGGASFANHALLICPELNPDLFTMASTEHHEFFHLMNDADEPNPNLRVLFRREVRAHGESVLFGRIVEAAVAAGKLTTSDDDKAFFTLFTRLKRLESEFKQSAFAIYDGYADLAESAIHPLYRDAIVRALRSNSLMAQGFPVVAELHKILDSARQQPNENIAPMLEALKTQHLQLRVVFGSMRETAAEINAALR